MKDRAIQYLIRLNLCPGYPQDDYGVCSSCPHRSLESGCERALRREATTILEQTLLEPKPVQNTPEPSLIQQVTKMLQLFGVPSKLRGHQYLRFAIMYAIRNPGVINAITKELYPTIAKEFDTTPTRAERAIRHAIEVAWSRGNPEVFNKWFGYTVNMNKGKPTNSEFIALVVDRIRLSMEERGKDNE